MSQYDTILHVYSATQSISKTAEIMGVNEQVVRRCIITAGIYSTERTDEIAHMKADGMSVPDIMCRTGLCQSAVVANMPYQRQYPRADWSVKQKALYLREWRKHKNKMHNKNAVE